MASLRPPSRCRPSWPSIRRRCPPRTRTPLRRRRSGDSKGFDENSLGELEFTFEVQRWMFFFLKDLLSDHLWIRLVVKQLVCPVQFFFRSPLDRGVHGENDDGPVGSVKAFLQRGDGVDGVMGVLTGLKAGRQGGRVRPLVISGWFLRFSWCICLTRPILLRHQFLLYKFVRF